jgi:hypothetical protein
LGETLTVLKSKVLIAFSEDRYNYQVVVTGDSGVYVRRFKIGEKAQLVTGSFPLPHWIKLVQKNFLMVPKDA